MKNYPKLYSQRDPRWASIQLGNAAGATIGDYGCYDTSFAMKACYYGKDTDPGRLNQDFRAGNVYINADMLTDNALQEIYGDIQYVQSDHYESVPADLSKLQGYMGDNSITVTLCIDMGSQGVHFVEAVDCDGKTVTIANPWDGQVEPFSNLYGDPATRILRYIVYKGTVGKPQITIDGQLYENLVNKSSKYDEFYNAGYQSVNDVKTALAQKDETISHLGDTITNRNGDIATLQGTVSTCQTQLTNANSSLAVVTEQAKKVPDLTKQVNDLTDSIEGTNGYKSQISTLRTQNGTLQTKLDNLTNDVIPTGVVSGQVYSLALFLQTVLKL